MKNNTIVEIHTRPIGWVLKIGFKRIVVTETNRRICDGCYFFKDGYCQDFEYRDFIGYCTNGCRTDKKDIFFRKLTIRERFTDFIKKTWSRYSAAIILLSFWFLILGAARFWLWAVKPHWLQLLCWALTIIALIKILTHPKILK